MFAVSNLVWVAIGGAAGAVSRYLVVAGSVWFGAVFPLGTLLVNVAGSFAIGALAAWLSSAGDWAADGRLLFQTGFLGAFTTFSAFSLETLALWQNGQARMAVLNVGLNVALCLIAVVIGHTLGAEFGRSD